MYVRLSDQERDKVNANLFQNVQARNNKFISGTLILISDGFEPIN